MPFGPNPPARLKVVMIDDDPLILKLVGKILARRGVDLVASSRSMGVLNLIAEHRPALVILDVNMPGLSGPSLVKLVREDPGIKGTSIVLYSSLEEGLLAEKVAECGADGYMSKKKGIAGLDQQLERWLPSRAPSP